MPLTTDYRAAITLIEACNTDQAGVQGTDISGVAETVLTANKRLGKGVAELVILQMERTRKKESVAAFKNWLIRA